MNYIETKDLLVRENSNISLKSVIFDIDGVLIDVKDSFRKAIVDTVQFYFERVLKVPGKAQLLSLWDTQTFKNTGGFNNDWDLSKAAVVFFLSKLFKANKRDMASIRYEGASLNDFLGKVKLVEDSGLNVGGSLDAVLKVALEDLNSDQKKDILGLYNPVYIKRIFQELYGGIDYCKKLYGFDPRFVKTNGLINQEKILIDTSLLNGFKNIGILTGRTREETNFALAKTKMGSIVSQKNVVFDDGQVTTKPSPDCLVKLCSNMGVSSGIYIGDTHDDAMMVCNYNAASTGGKFSLAMVSNRPDIYVGKADIIGVDVNTIVEYLKEL